MVAELCAARPSAGILTLSSMYIITASHEIFMRVLTLHQTVTFLDTLLWAHYSWFKHSLSGRCFLAFCLSLSLCPVELEMHQWKVHLFLAMPCDNNYLTFLLCSLTVHWWRCFNVDQMKACMHHATSYSDIVYIDKSFMDPYGFRVIHYIFFIFKLLLALCTS